MQFIPCGEIDHRFQYHQHFMNNFFVWKSFLLPSYLCLQFEFTIFVDRKIVQKLLIKCWRNLTTGRKCSFLWRHNLQSQKKLERDSGITSEQILRQNLRQPFIFYRQILFHRHQHQLDLWVHQLFGQLVAQSRYREGDLHFQHHPQPHWGTSHFHRLRLQAIGFKYAEIEVATKTKCDNQRERSSLVLGLRKKEQSNVIN